MGTDCLRVSRVVQAVREVNDELTVRQLAILLWLNENPESGVTTIAEKLDLAKGTVSRNLKTLGSYFEKIGDNFVERGFGLIKAERDKYSERNVNVSLTKKGMDLIKTIHQASE